METKVTAARAILFVDDEETIRKSFARELEVEGFSVTTAADGSEGISLLENGHFDLLITDLVMPGIDGFAVLKAAKKLAPTISVIILTGYGDMRSAIDALRLGADDFTQKPCEVEELVFRIRACLEKRNLLQRLSLQNQQLAEEIKRRQLVEEQLLASEARFRLALDASSNGVWDRNLSTGEVYFGENWHRSLGYEDKAELNSLSAQTKLMPLRYKNEISGGDTFENLLHPDDRERVLALRTAHIQGDTPRYEAEFRMRNKAGGWQWILSRGQVVARDEQGNALRIIGTHTDITRLKAVEAELAEAAAVLEQRVQERTVELSEANIALTVLLKKRDEDRTILGEKILSNTSALVEPFLDKLRESKLTEQQIVLVDILSANISELTSPFVRKFSTQMIRLTPAEMQVANLVKLGKRTKEIAAILHLSPGTISIYRKNIRKKLELTHQKTNLQTTLSIHS
ncbi:MAG: response regulator [Pseudomonadota bacterium]